MGKGFQRFIYLLSRLMQVIAGIALCFMMSLTTCDVILRAFGKPIIGTYEMVSFTGGVVIGFSVPITSWVRGHIFVDFFYQKFSKMWQNLFNVCTRILSLAFFVFLGWNLMILASDMLRSGEVSLTLQLPFYPVAYGIGFAAFVECLVLIGDFVKIAGGEYE
ncbi:MAG: Tripartite ATP-independent periplasmic transporter [Syntrophorhabdaceae bacterium PtaU1.Bin034]|nr:MAG: Tripartite ATP-independent periplasmic transporter [Syntrophorhabdaceae bacterium PtaU1.Bin034]